jgi:hypothetical protein
VSKPRILEIAGREVTVTNPDKLVFPSGGHTKLDLVSYYLAVADAALRGVAGRPMILKRFVKGIDQEAFFQKRAPSNRPDWIEVAELHYASGRSGPRRSLSGTPPRWPGWSTWAASTSIHTPCSPRISTIPTSCGSIWTRCLVSTGNR